MHPELLAKEIAADQLQTAQEVEREREIARRLEASKLLNAELKQRVKELKK